MRQKVFSSKACCFSAGFVDLADFVDLAVEIVGYMLHEADSPVEDWYIYNYYKKDFDYSYSYLDSAVSPLSN